MKGCEWKPHEYKELGVRLYYQDCADKNAHYELTVKGSAIEEHRPSDDGTFGGPRLLEVFSKKEDQPIEEAISEQFLAKLEPKAGAGCRVVKLKNPPFALKGKKLFTIDSFGAYGKEIEKDLQSEPRDFGCGPYGRDQAITYFEYHPQESRTKFLFVVFGMDEQPLFDAASIELLK